MKQKIALLALFLMLGLNAFTQATLTIEGDSFGVRVMLKSALPGFEDWPAEIIFEFTKDDMLSGRTRDWSDVIGCVDFQFEVEDFKFQSPAAQLQEEARLLIGNKLDFDTLTKLREAIEKESSELENDGRELAIFRNSEQSRKLLLTFYNQEYGKALGSMNSARSLLQTAIIEQAEQMVAQGQRPSDEELTTYKEDALALQFSLSEILSPLERFNDIDLDEDRNAQYAWVAVVDKHLDEVKEAQRQIWNLQMKTLFYQNFQSNIDYKFIRQYLDFAEGRIIKILRRT